MNYIKIIIILIIIIFSYKIIKNITNKNEKKKFSNHQQFLKRIENSHKYCANMGENSPAMTTTGVPVLNKNGKNKKWFPVSVCCATCLCHFWPNKNSDRFYYKLNNTKKQYELYKRIKLKKDKIVQYLDHPKTSQIECEKLIKKNKNIYLTFLSYDRIDSICKLMK